MSDHTGFTGTREGMTTPQTVALLEVMRKKPIYWHHGDCLGADEESHSLAVGLGMRVILHPPVSSSMRAFCKGHDSFPVKGFIARNHEIVDATASMVAAPASMVEQSRGGTWATVRYARGLRRPITIVFPDGSVKQELPA